jgi:hypothetical protein
MTYAGFRTRKQLKLRAPKSRSTNVSPEDGGVAVHWGGPGNSPKDHEKCEERWRAWQNFHMDGRKWVDIAYNFGFCNHGYVLAGRGYGVRSAGQGTNDGNDMFMAACFVGGEDGPVANVHAIDALKWIIAECRRLGAGQEVRPHYYFHSTGCPGARLAIEANSLHNKSVTISKPKPPPIVKPTPLPEVEMALEPSTPITVTGSAKTFIEQRSPGAVGADNKLPFEWFVVWGYVEQVKTRELLTALVTDVRTTNQLLQHVLTSLSHIEEDVDDDAPPVGP